MVKRGWRINLILFLLGSWAAWFTIKVSIWGGVHEDIGERVGIAVDSSRKIFTLLTQTLFALTRFIYSWGNVMLPFVQDIVGVTRNYLIPHFVSPIASFLKVYIFKLNTYIPFEYKLGIVLFSILIFNTKISKYWKFMILNILFHLFTYRFTYNVLTNNIVKQIFFIYIPIGIFLFGRITKKISSNLLFLFTVAPLLWYMQLSGMVYHCAIWSWVFGLYYFSNSEEIIAQYIWARKPLFLTKLRLKLLDPITRWYSDRISHSKIFEFLFKLSLRKNSGFFSFIFSLVRSTPSLVLLVVLGLILLAVFYYAFSSLSRLLTLSVWPWYFAECGRTLLYRRSEDYESQLAFALLFLGFELVVLPNHVIGWFASLLHLPLLFVFKLTPLIIMGIFRKLVAAMSGLLKRGKQQQQIEQKSPLKDQKDELECLLHETDATEQLLENPIEKTDVKEKDV